LLTCTVFGGAERYLEKTLDPAELAELQRHVNECPNCFVFATRRENPKGLKGMDAQPYRPEFRTPHGRHRKWKRDKALRGQKHASRLPYRRPSSYSTPVYKLVEAFLLIGVNTSLIRAAVFGHIFPFVLNVLVIFP